MRIWHQIDFKSISCQIRALRIWHEINFQAGLPTLEVLGLPVEAAVRQQLRVYASVGGIVDVLEEDAVHRLRHFNALGVG